MTVEQLIEALHGVDRKLEIFAVCGSSGSTYEVSYPRPHIKNDNDDIGALCELKDGTKVVLISLD